MSDQWGAPVPQPDGSWPPQPAPAHTPGPSQHYPQQPPVPPSPAAPYTDPYTDPYGGPYAQSHQASGLSWGQSPAAQSAPAESGYPQSDPYAAPPAYQAPAPQLQQSPVQQASQAQQFPQMQQSAQRQQPVQPEYRSLEQPQYHSQPSASLYTSVPPPPSTYPPDQPPYPPAPAPEAFPQPPFPQAPGGPPISTPAGMSARPANAFAVIGAVTSFVPIIGLVFSIIGLAKAKLLGGIGRSAASLGVALSLIFIPGWCVAGYFVFQAVTTTSGDPGCVAAEADYLTYSRTLDADAAAMAETKYGTRQFTDAVKTYQADFQLLIGRLQADSARAQYADVHTAITSLIADLQQLDNVMGDLASGDFAAAGRLGDVSTLNGKLFSDYEQTQSVCKSHTGG